MLRRMAIATVLILLTLLLAPASPASPAQVRITGSGVTFSGSGVTISVGQIIPASYFGLQFNSCSLGSNYPTPGGGFFYGTVRYWDFSGCVERPFIYLTNSTPSWTNFDPWMAFAKTNGLRVILNMGRTPDWASAYGSRCVAAGNPDATCLGPADFTCAYSGAPPTPPAGECWPAADLNPDGTGTDATYIAQVGGIASHLAGLSSSTYVNTAIWEPSNEVNIGGQWSGTVAQMTQMTIDASTAILAANSHNIVTSPNTVEWNFPLVTGIAQYQGQYFGSPLLASDVSMISIHTYMSLSGNTGQFPCLPGPAPACTQGVGPPEELVNLLAQVRRAVPIWPNYSVIATEFSWGQNNTSFCDPDMRKAFMREMLIGWSLGFQSMSWYHYDDSHSCSDALATPTSGGDSACLGHGYPAVPGVPTWTECPAGIAYQQLYSWMVGNIMDQPCNGPVPNDTNTGTNWGLWTCHFLRPNGTQSLAAWRTDPAYTCASGTCPTVGYTVTGPYTKYYTLDSGTATTISGGCSTSCTVQIGAKPILLSN